LRKSRQSFSHSHQEEATINLTPLIDVVFVVLIIFILIAPMLELDRVQLASASQRDKRDAVQENSPIAIHVRADNSVWINNKCVNSKQLLEILKDAQKKYPHKIPQLFHDRKAYFESYQSVKNAVELAGFEQLDVVLQPG
jgi:biopolymer transport protein ExbD